MTPAVEQLVRETMELTGAPRPPLLEDDAPVLSDDALRTDDGASFYLVGLIGGKEVGKSALVNALAGQAITRTTSHGPGTEKVIAYAHRSQEQPVRALLEREVPGRYEIVTHDLSDVRRQVLLDLPDIDSHFASHIQVTRTMLRHMLYPVWVGSVEKYADRQPQQMLAKVAAGNAPRNFVFCLNKVDQLESAAPAAGQAATQELREDYAARIARALSLESAPQVYLISATHPAQYDLPALRAALSREKSARAVRESKDLALRRQDRSLLDWLDTQQLPHRAQRLTQLQQDAEELATARIAVPVIEQVIPRLLDDPTSRSAMAEEILTERVARWPVVNLVHTLLSPLFVLVRSITARNAAPLQTAEGLVETVTRESGQSVAAMVQSTFAQLRQTQPPVAELYSHRRLWEDMPADLAAAKLTRALAATIERQREAARTRLTVRNVIAAPFRWLLTIGAIIWFPFAQPILQAILGDKQGIASWTERAALLVKVLAVPYLLQSAGFLIIWFAVLWLALRWNTQRKVSRLVVRWKAADFPDPSLNLPAQTMQWVDDLLTPIRQAKDRMESLARRLDEVRGSQGKAA